jgi:hypothetical protein
LGALREHLPNHDRGDIEMHSQTHPTQVFTVFGSYVLDGDTSKFENARSSNQVRCDARKVELNDALRETVRQ